MDADLRPAVELRRGRTPEPYAETVRNPHECRALVNGAVRKVLNGNATIDAIRYAVLLSSSGNWTFANEGAHPAHVALGAALAASRTPDACNANLPPMNDSGT